MKTEDVFEQAPQIIKERPVILPKGRDSLFQDTEPGVPEEIHVEKEEELPEKTEVIPQTEQRVEE